MIKYKFKKQYITFNHTIYRITDLSDCSNLQSFANHFLKINVCKLNDSIIQVVSSFLNDLSVHLNHGRMKYIILIK